MTSEAGGDRRVVSDLADLVGLTELTNVVFMRVSAERIDPKASSDEEEQVGLRAFQRSDESQVEVRCVMLLKTEDARLLADASVHFTHSEPLDVEEPVLQDFTQKVGIMAVYPYLRESIHTSAARLGVTPPVLSLLKANELELAPEQSGPGGPLEVATSGKD